MRGMPPDAPQASRTFAWPALMTCIDCHARTHTGGGGARVRELAPSAEAREENACRAPGGRAWLKAHARARALPLTSLVDDLVSPCSPMACLNILNSASVTGEAAHALRGAASARTHARAGTGSRPRRRAHARAHPHYARPGLCPAAAGCGRCARAGPGRASPCPRPRPSQAPFTIPVGTPRSILAAGRRPPARSPGLRASILHRRPHTRATACHPPPEAILSSPVKPMVDAKGRRVRGFASGRLRNSQARAGRAVEPRKWAEERR